MESGLLDYMTDAGFALEWTGVDCNAFVRNVDGLQARVTARNSSRAPESLNDPCDVGVYALPDDEVGREWEVGTYYASNAAEAVEAARNHIG